MNALRPISYYDERAETVDLNDITSDYQNAEILRRLRDNDPDLSRLYIRQHGNNWGDAFFLQEGDDLGWLVYFIGRNTVLTTLTIILRQDIEQITTLVGGIEQNRSIQRLCICGDRLGESVLSSLSTMLQFESCCLTTLELYTYSSPLRDDAAVALADALKGNKSLRTLWFNPGDLTPMGWSAFSKLLCDTSSASNIYASNHTLRGIGYGSYNRINYPQARQDVEQLLALNGLTDKHAAIQKILKYHPDFDIGPFLAKWKLKSLPLVMSWFERVRGISEESEKAFDTRQLTTMYKFVRSMPGEAIDGYSRHSIHKKRKFDLLDHNLILMCTPVLLCLLDLLLPTWSDFVAPSITLCICLLEIASFTLCLVVVIGGAIGGAIGALVV
jgi:hypothetical protein